MEEKGFDCDDDSRTGLIHPHIPSICPRRNHEIPFSNQRPIPPYALRKILKATQEDLDLGEVAISATVSAESYYADGESVQGDTSAVVDLETDESLQVRE